MTGSREGDERSALPDGVAVSIGTVEPLLNRAGQTQSATDLVIAPVELHRRNLKRRLTNAGLPLDAFRFTEPGHVASLVLAKKGRATGSLDRVDRLALLGEILTEETEVTDRFRMILGGKPGQNGKAVEQVRTELEAMTNYHPARVDGFRRVAESVPAPIDADACDVLTGTIAVERELGRRTSKATSERAVVRRATRALAGADGSAWAEAFPTVERVVVVGLSTVPAPLVDLVAAIAATCDVEVRWMLRRGTGPFLKTRLTELLAVPTPGRVVVT
ncbi:hypothetical protein CP556_14535 [Natrinema sp. CBA1119]|uniref:hypothetical protein n=1 Tax=Natrinema sp. CBA1119 TaxID=1608465 RepID=UPI000BF8402F|nr:hypothetical protein [Natrinema sp. CBA1119]PGF17202.1 hypothetical protein CP556_14535 [Natrinema sp. CBA1119]